MGELETPKTHLVSAVSQALPTSDGLGSQEEPRDWTQPQADSGSNSGSTPNSLHDLGPAVPLLWVSHHFHLLDGYNACLPGQIGRFREMHIGLTLQTWGWCEENK